MSAVPNRALTGLTVIGMLVAIVVPFALTCVLSMKIIRPGYRVA